MNDKGTLKPLLFERLTRDLAVRVDRKRSSRRHRDHSPQELITKRSYQRVGGMVVIPDLLREMGVDPITVLSRAGLDGGAISDAENKIPYVSMGRLFHECALATGCP